MRHMEDLPFWLDLADRQGGPILELGCGSGRVLLPLGQAGHQVFGLDNHPGMLSVLRQNLPDHLAPLVHFFVADLAHFHLEASFRLILLTCNTYSTLSTPQRRAALDNVCRHLRPGGLFAASLPNPEYLKNLARKADPEVEETFPHPVDGEPVQVSSAWERTRTHFVLSWIYDHLLPDGQVERASIQVRHALVPTQTYLRELRSAGLQVLQTFGDFDGSPFTQDSSYLIFLAEATQSSN